MVSPSKASVLVAGALALAGCGGGGGGGEAPAANLAALTSSNAPAIASAVMSASVEGSDLGGFAAFGPSGAPATTGTTSRVQAKAAKIQQAHVEAVLDQSATAVALLDPDRGGRRRALPGH